MNGGSGAIQPPNSEGTAARDDSWPQYYRPKCECVLLLAAGMMYTAVDTITETTVVTGTDIKC